METLELINSSLTATLISASVFGLLVGSFLNVVIARLPVMLDREWKAQAREVLELEEDNASTPFNLAVPRSTCPKCGHMITAWENIPVISWLFLRGRCSQCKSSISPRYPAIEILTALVAAVLAYNLQLSTLFAFGFIGSCLLISLFFIDWDYQLLPDKLTLPLLWLGLIVNFYGHIVSLEQAVLGTMIGYLSLWSVYWLFKLVTGKEGMGYGDFKLLAAAGAWFGWQALLPIILLSSIVGALLGIIVLKLKPNDQGAIAFGPFIILATATYAIAGQMIVAIAFPWLIL